MAFTTQIPMNHPRRLVIDFIRNPETWFRLNPEWEVHQLTISSEEDSRFTFILEVRYDRTEMEAAYRGSIEMWPDEQGITL